MVEFRVILMFRGELEELRGFWKRTQEMAGRYEGIMIREGLIQEIVVRSEVIWGHSA